MSTDSENTTETILSLFASGASPDMSECDYAGVEFLFSLMEDSPAQVFDLPEVCVCDCHISCGYEAEWEFRPPQEACLDCPCFGNW